MEKFAVSEKSITFATAFREMRPVKSGIEMRQ